MPIRTLCAISLGLICSALTLTGCRQSHSTAANRYYHIADEIWDTQDTARFILDSIPSEGDYRLSLQLRTTSELPLQKIYLVAEQRYESPPSYRKDTVCVLLTDTTGKRLGAGVGLSSYTAATKPLIHIRKGQSGQIKVYHIMRRTQLKGIADIGIVLKNENSSY